MFCNPAGLYILLLAWNSPVVNAGLGDDFELVGPSFTKEPLAKVILANTVGANIDCSANGNPTPTISWVMLDKMLISDIPHIRITRPNGTLAISPFRSEQFRPDVHAAVYRCLATNPVGTIMSREVHVQGVVIQPYDAQVYDTYAMEKNTAILKCHIPDVVKDYVSVTAWIKNDNLLIQSSGYEVGDKYAIMQTGELHIREVTAEEAGSTYKCKTLHHLTGESVISKLFGRLYVTESHGSISATIVDSFPFVTTTVNEKVILPCVGQGFPVPTMKWYKKNGSGIEETIIFKDDHFLLSKSGLIVTNVQMSDAATYRCEIANELGKEHLDVTLNVIGPMSAVVHPRRHFARVGDSITFECSVFGNLAFAVSWLHNGMDVPKRAHNVTEDNVFQIKNIQASDRGMYQCMVKSGDGRVIHATAELQLSEIVPQLIDVFEEVSLQPGSTVGLNCVAFGVPTPTVFWQMDSISLESRSRIHITNEEQGDGKIKSQLIIDNMVTEDGGVYTCLAKNKAGTAEHTSRINVYGSLHNRQVPKMLAVSGTTAYLNCPVYGYPIEKITWKKDGRLLPRNLRQYIFYNGTLKINNMEKPVDEGLYVCTASSANAERVESSVDIQIIVAPKIIPFEFQDDLLREGMRARLQCVVSHGDLPLTITWLKDGKPLSPEMGVLVRVLDDFSSILTIGGIKPGHNGKYTCVASNRAATDKHTAELSVNVAPKIVPFHFRDLPYEGSTARMVCGLQEGDMPIRFSWLYNGTPVRIDATNPIHIHETEGISSILSISNLMARHTGTYTCTAENKAGVARHDFVLLVHVPPKIVPFSFKEDHLVKGLLARVSCVVSRGDLPLELQWEKDGMPIVSSSEAFPGVHIRSFDEHSSILSIANISRQHNGLYTCIANNHAGSARHSVQLTVNVPPRWIIEPQNIATLEGKDVMINCVAEGHPQPTITWVQTKDLESESDLLKPIQDGENINVFPNGTLLLKAIDTTNAGYYFCKAINGIGNGLSTMIEVKINAPPKFKKLFEKLNAAAGQDFQLQCLSEGNLPMYVTWLKDREPLKEVVHKRYRIETTNTSSEVLSVLIIHKVKRSDNGEYECKVQNKYGENKTVMHLMVLEIPDPPKNVKATAIGGRTIELSWEAAFTGNLHIKKYLIQYINAAGNWNNAIIMEMKNGNMASGIIAQLQPATKYLFRVFAENNLGRSESSEIIEAITKEELPSGPPLNIQVETVNMDTFKITFKPPEERLWNGKIQGYYIGYKAVDSDGPYHFKTLLTPEPHNAELLVEISGLQHFTKYAIVVQAYNGRGRGPESEPVVAMTSEGAPRLPPTAPRCTTLTSQSIHVTWEAPPQDSINGILRGYKVMYKPATEWYDDVAESFVITPTTSETLSSLDKFTNYTVRVHARTKAGDGPSSETVFCKTLDDVPDPPMDIKVVASADNAVIVVWKPPEQTNGVIKSYTIYWKLLTDKASGSHTVSADDRSYEVTRLRKDQHYDFWVTASTMAGEGMPTRRVSHYLQGPSIPAKIVAFDSKVIIPWKTDVILSCLAVGSPQPDKQWTTGDKRIMDKASKNVLADGSLSIKSIQEKDSGDYTCYVQNAAGEDRVTYTIVVLGPPPPPLLKVVSTTPYSIEIKWQINGTNMNVKGLNLHLRQDASEWTKMNLGGKVRSYQITQLECGTRYEIYLVAFNKIGTGAPSEMITVFTNGSVPTAPEKYDLIEESSTSVSLFLNTWKSDVCPIQYYMVEYAKKTSSDWTFVSNNVKPEQRRLVIPGLKPGTWYSLRMTAHNSAGSMTAEYSFATLTLSGATVLPNFNSETEVNYLMIFLSVWVILPVSITVVILITILAVACIYVRSNTQPPKRRGKGQRNSTASSQLIRSNSNNSFACTDSDTLTRSHQNIDRKGMQDSSSPRATFHLASKVLENLSHHGALPPPPPPPRRLENFSNEGSLDFNNRFIAQNMSRNMMMPGHTNMETTFIFPNTNLNQAGPSSSDFPIKYPSEALKMKLN